MRFLCGSSYFDGGIPYRREFSRVWHWNTMKADPAPTRVVIVAEGGSNVGMIGSNTEVVHLTGDLGHIGSHLNGTKKHAFTGWSASMCALAMLAYSDEADLVYKEEDCLAFGPWVRKMYEDLGDGDMVFGAKHQSPPWMECSQALFLVRHRFLPTLVSMYLAMGADKDVLGENKFRMIEDRFGPERIRRLSFGVDRERPIPWEAPVFYAQQVTHEELDEAKRRGMI